MARPFSILTSDRLTATHDSQTTRAYVENAFSILTSDRLTATGDRQTGWGYSFDFQYPDRGLDQSMTDYV